MGRVEELCDEIAMLKAMVEKYAAKMACMEDTLSRLAAENASLKEAPSRLAAKMACLKEGMAKLAAENASLKEALSERDSAMADSGRRLAYYDNPHSPPSSNSIPTRQRKARARSAGGQGAPAPRKKAAGRKKGHAGRSHNRKPESTEIHRPESCAKCGCRALEYGTPASKLVTDLVTIPKVVTVLHQSYPATCRECDHVTGAEVPGIPGTEFGPNLASTVADMHAMPASIGAVRRHVAGAFKIRMSEGAIGNCLLAVTAAARPVAELIAKEMHGSEFLHMDETVIMIAWRQGYIWIAMSKRGGKVVAVLVKVARGRGDTVIDLLFPYGHIPVTVDGTRRIGRSLRCWAHVLREARHLCEADRRLHCLYVRRKEIYYVVREPGPGPGDRELHDRMVAEVAHIADEYSRAGSRFGVTMGRAAPNLFTFLLHPGMEPTNNLAERSLRPSVIAKKIRHSLKTEDGMGVFGILMTCVMTWRARGRTSARCSGTCCRAPWAPTRWHRG